MHSQNHFVSFANISKHDIALFLFENVKCLEMVPFHWYWIRKWISLQTPRKSNTDGVIRWEPHHCSQSLWVSLISWTYYCLLKLNWLSGKCLMKKKKTSQSTPPSTPFSSDFQATVSFLTNILKKYCKIWNHF